MIRNFLYCAATLALAGGAFAQIPAPLDIQIALNGTAVLPLNGDPDNVEFDGVAVTPSASTVYVFDSVGTFDGIFTSVGPAVFATEAQLSGGGTSASAGDMDADANNIYVGIFDGSKQRVTRIPHTGFAGAAEMVDSSGILSVNIDEINVDAKNSRLMMNYNDAFGAAAEDIVHVPLNATSAAPTLLATEAQLETALATIPGYVDDTTDDINVFDMAVQSDGDIIVSHGFSSNRQVNGSLLRITETGAVSVFRTADQIITSAGADPAAVDIGSVNIVRLSDDQILIHVQLSSNNATLDPFMAVVSADGASQVQLATRTQLASDPDASAIVPAGQSLFRMDGKGGDMAANDDYYFYRQSNFSGTAAESAVLKLTGVRAFLNGASSVDAWALY